MTRVAAIDCGTNSIRLLVADLDAATGTFHELDRRMEIVRLGQGVDRTGRLAPEALERTLAACRRYAAVLDEHGLDGQGARRLRFAATSATRDADNREEFVCGVRELLGVEPQVLTGAQEAELSFTGATRELAAAPLDRPFLVVDIGGGSTEFVLGDTHVQASRSVDIGCVRLTERHALSDPPTAAQVAAMRDDVHAALEAAARTVPLEEAGTLVGLAGTVTTLAGVALKLDAYDSTAIHHSRLTAAQVAAISDRLLASTHEERAAIPVMHPGRVDVITAGALILREVMERTGAPDVVVSEHDILDGLAWSLTETS
jgi:exopolyphosphatase/guanosine-5'-triphosphate,3'-diphosphate pyrophosphatase